MSSDYIFVFDLDSTITAEEILPKVAKTIGKEKEMSLITEETMKGAIPFKESFIRRVSLLSELSLNDISDIIYNTKLNEKIASFVREHKDRCYIVTGNLDIFVKSLMDRLDMTDRFFSSKGYVEENGSVKLISVVDKQKVADQFVNKIVAIGDGSNDAEIIDMAEVGIGYGGVRKIADSVLETCDFACYNEDVLVNFLEKLL